MPAWVSMLMLHIYNDFILPWNIDWERHIYICTANRLKTVHYDVCFEWHDDDVYIAWFSHLVTVQASTCLQIRADMYRRSFNRFHWQSISFTIHLHVMLHWTPRDENSSEWWFMLAPMMRTSALNHKKCWMISSFLLKMQCQSLMKLLFRLCVRD